MERSQSESSSVDRPAPPKKRKYPENRQPSMKRNFRYGGQQGLFSLNDTEVESSTNKSQVAERSKDPAKALVRSSSQEQQPTAVPSTDTDRLRSSKVMPVACETGGGKSGDDVGEYLSSISEPLAALFRAKFCATDFLSVYDREILNNLEQTAFDAFNRSESQKRLRGVAIRPTDIEEQLAASLSYMHKVLVGLRHSLCKKSDTWSEMLYSHICQISYSYQEFEAFYFWISKDCFLTYDFRVQNSLIARLLLEHEFNSISEVIESLKSSKLLCGDCKFSEEIRGKFKRFISEYNFVSVNYQAPVDKYYHRRNFVEVLKYGYNPIFNRLIHGNGSVLAAWNEAVKSYLEGLVRKGLYREADEYLDRCYERVYALQQAIPELAIECDRILAGLNHYRALVRAELSKHERGHTHPPSTCSPSPPPPWPGDEVPFTLPDRCEHDVSWFDPCVDCAAERINSSNPVAMEPGTSESVDRPNSSQALLEHVPTLKSAFNIGQFWTTQLSRAAEIVLKGWSWAGRVFEFATYVNVSHLICVVDES